MDINDYALTSGRMLREDGTTVNIVDILAKDADGVGIEANIESFSPMSGRFIREDGAVVNLADLLADLDIGDGAFDIKAITKEDINNLFK